MRQHPDQQPGFDDSATLHRRLRAWFRRRARDLPWRRRRTLYGTWIAEIMLQQTTVATVVPYWERFLARFPDVDALAAADEAEVLALWSGLGYYRRARSLHAAARRLAEGNRGQLPADAAGWRELPGVGPYAAGAIASMGLGESVPAVDANVRRVLTRWASADPDQAARLTARRLEEMAAILVPARSPGEWNEALMELGALVCTPRSPDCDGCPVGDACRAGRSGTAALVPPPRSRAAPTPVLAGVLVACHGEQVLLLPPGAPCATAVPVAGDPLRDDFGGLHRGLWGLPVTPWYGADHRDFTAAAGAAWSAWLAAGGGAAVRVVSAGRVTHAITRWRLDVRIHGARIPAPAVAGLARVTGGRWSDPRRTDPVSGLVGKVIAEYSRNRDGG